MKSVLTLDEVAKHFGVCRRTIVRVFIQQLGLRGMRLPGGWRFRLEDIAQFEAEQARTHIREVG